MCMYSVTAGNSRDARQGEDLVVTQASHGQSNWLTEPGKPAVAVCIPHTAVLAVQLPGQRVRGATFEQAKQADESGDRDFLNYLDGGNERLGLNRLPKSTKVRVLHLFAHKDITPVIPESIGAAVSEEEELVPAAVGSRRGFSRLFRSF